MLVTYPLISPVFLQALLLVLDLAIEVEPVTVNSQFSQWNSKNLDVTKSLHSVQKALYNLVNPSGRF